MSEEIIYTSSIAEWITGFIQEKKSLGYKYFNESKWMRMSFSKLFGGVFVSLFGDKFRF